MINHNTSHLVNSHPRVTWVVLIGSIRQENPYFITSDLMQIYLLQKFQSHTRLHTTRKRKTYTCKYAMTSRMQQFDIQQTHTATLLSWIKCKIMMKIQEQRNASRTAQRRLVAAIHQCIIQHMQDPLLEPTIEDLVKSHNYILYLIMKMCQKIQVNTFCLKMYITTKNTWLFMICSLYLYQWQFINIDAQTLHYLIACAGGDHVKGNHAKVFWNAFNFTKISIVTSALNEYNLSNFKVTSNIKNDEL